MKKEELVQQVMAVLRDSFKSVKDPELRHFCAAEKIVNNIITPTVRDHEQALLRLLIRRSSVYDS